METQTLLKIGNGRSVHMAAQRDSEEDRYKTLCGAERPGRQWNYAYAWIEYKASEATCKKCLDIVGNK